MSYRSPLVGRSLRLLREERGLKSREVAEKIGVGPSHYSEIENGRRPVGTSLLERLAEVYGTTTEELRERLRLMSGSGEAEDSRGIHGKSPFSVRETEVPYRSVISRVPDANALAAHLVSAMPREEVFRLLHELTAAGEAGDAASLQKARALLDLIPECHPTVDAGGPAGG